MSASAPTPPAQRELLLLALLVLVAAALRLHSLDVAPGYSGDEGYEAFYGWQTAEHRIFQQNPVRPYLGPWFLWLMAPFIGGLGPGPLGARLPVALLGTAGVVLAWAIGRRLAPERAATSGLLAAGLFAVAPFAVLFSRLSLSVATTPFWVLLGVLATLQLAERPDAGRGLALGLVVGAAVSFHPQGLLLGVVAAAVGVAIAGRAVLVPRVLGAAALGFAAVAWPVWVMILDQVGLGPGIDYSGTWVDGAEPSPLAVRAVRSVPQVLDGLVGGRMLHWVAGPSSADPPGEWLGLLCAAGLLGSLGWALARGERIARSLAGGLGLAWALTVLRSAEFDLGGLTRERYLLTTLTLLVPLLAWAAATLPWARWLAGGLAVVQGLALITGFFVPMATTGGDAEPSFVSAQPDAKVEAAAWIRSRLGPDEEGLLLAGDAWSYWPLVSLLGERMPADFVPEDPAACAAVLARTSHRRRWLVDYPGWHWNRVILDCLERAGAPTTPAFVPTSVGGAPALLVWELPPTSPAKGTP